MAGGGEGLLEQVGLGEGPAREGRGFDAGGIAQADLGVAVLEFFDHFVREGAAAGDFGEVFGHLAEDVGSSVGEEKDGGGVGIGTWLGSSYTGIPSPCVSAKYCKHMGCGSVCLFCHKTVLKRLGLRVGVYDLPHS